MESSIAQKMLEEHQRLGKLLQEFEASGENFSKFKWSLEKHFFVEEKAILELYDQVSGEKVEETFRIMQEHEKILDLIKKIETQIGGDLTPDLIPLKEALKEHEDFEDDIFYPELDRLLSDNQKKELGERIDEVIRV